MGLGEHVGLTGLVGLVMPAVAVELNLLMVVDGSEVADMSPDTSVLPHVPVVPTTVPALWESSDPLQGALTPY